MKPFKFIFYLFLAVIGIYFAIFYFQTTSLPSVLRIADYDSIKGVPPASCHFAWSDGSSNSINGDMHVLNGIIRFDYTVKVPWLSTLVHMVVSQEGTAFAWNEGSHQGIRGKYETVAAQTGLSSIEAVPCSPWWVPDGLTLLIPQDAAFSEIKAR